MYISNEPIFIKNKEMIEKTFSSLFKYLGTEEFAIMGGSLSSILFDLSVRDYDVFVRNDKIYQNIIKKLIGDGWSIKFKRDHSTVFWKDGEKDIDLVLMNGLDLNKDLALFLVEISHLILQHHVLLMIKMAMLLINILVKIFKINF